MKPKSVVEIILLPHIAMVVSKQHHHVTETLPTSIKYIAKKQVQQSQRPSEASHPPQRD